MDLREDAEAERDFKQALKLDPASSATKNNYGLFLCQRKRGAEGVRYLLDAIKNPRYATPDVAYKNAGLCSLSMGDKKAAEEFFLRALRLNPAQPQALFNMAELEYGRGRYARRETVPRPLHERGSGGGAGGTPARCAHRAAAGRSRRHAELRQPAAPALSCGAGNQGLSRRTLLMSSQEPDNSGLTEPADTPQPPAPGASVGRPGAQLLAERRAQGLSLGDVARQLKLSVRQVEALERDEYAAFPGPVFARGFLRNYAKLLQLDAEALVAQRGDLGRPVGVGGRVHSARPVPLHESGGGRRSRFGFGTLALGLVLVIVAVAAIYDARNKPAPVSLTPGPAGPSGQARSLQHADSPPPSSPAASVTPAPTPAVSADGHDGLDASCGRPCGRG